MLPTKTHLVRHLDTGKVFKLVLKYAREDFLVKLIKKSAVTGDKVS